MALVVADRVKETTTTTGTGAYSLAGAEDSFQAFGDVLSNSDTTYYAITDGTYWEVGIGTYTSSTDTLARTTILESSNSDAAVNWTAGEKQIFATMPADKVVYKDANGSLPNTDVDGTLTASNLVIADKITHEGDTNSYLQFNANDQFRVVVNNTEQLHVSSTGLQVQGKITHTGDTNNFLEFTNDAIKLAAPNGVTFTGSVRLDQEDKTGNGGTLTLDLATANNFKISMTADTTIAFSNKNPGYGGNLIFVQDATGGHDFTLPSECKTPVNGAAIVQNTGANEIAILSYYVLSSTQILVNYIGDFA